MIRPIVGFAMAVARFLYRFVFGDDWTVAVVMLLGLVASGLMVAAGINAWWLIPPLALAMTAASLERRRAGSGRPSTITRPSSSAAFVWANSRIWSAAVDTFRTALIQLRATHAGSWLGQRVGR